MRPNQQTERRKERKSGRFAEQSGFFGVDVRARLMSPVLSLPTHAIAGGDLSHNSYSPLRSEFLRSHPPSLYYLFLSKPDRRIQFARDSPRTTTTGAWGLGGILPLGPPTLVGVLGAPKPTNRAEEGAEKWKIRGAIWIFRSRRTSSPNVTGTLPPYPRYCWRRLES